MHQEANLILTGFMATGKTTVGRLAAKELGYTFVDTDLAIALKEQQTVAEIFASKGEMAFRRMEHEMAKELAAQNRLVISTGGKLLLDEENKNLLGSTGQIFCLTATTETILKRLATAEAERPLLAVGNPRQEIEKLLAQRSRGYRHFPAIDTTGKTPVEISTILVSLFLSSPTP